MKRMLAALCGLLLAMGCATIEDWFHDHPLPTPPPEPAPTNAPPIPDPQPEPEPEPTPAPAPLQPLGRTNWTYRVGAETILGPGRLSSVALDAAGQPHVAADGGTWLRLYQRIGGNWRDCSTNLGSVARQFYNPHVEIDGTGIVWISGCVFGSQGQGPTQTGAGTIVQRPPARRLGYSVRRIQGAWDQGNLATVAPGEAVWMSARGNWQRLKIGNGLAVATVGRGVLYAGNSGEKVGFDITGPVWHVAAGGYRDANGGGCDSGYQASWRTGQQPAWWASRNAYPEMGDDGSYVSVAGDLKRPRRAYLAAGYAGVSMNVWDGERMLYSPSRLLTIDRRGSSGLRRFAPQLAAAQGGGCFILWTRDGRIKARYVQPDGKLDRVELDVSAGTCAVGVCEADALHVTYQTGGRIGYRRVRLEARP